MNVKTPISNAQTLKPTELKEIKKLTIMGYMYATESMRKFCNTVVLSSVPQVHVSDFKPSFTSKHGAAPEDEIYVLSTDILGVVSCKSYFVLTAKEAEQIIKMVSSATGMGAEMGDELLKEADNILAAGMITCFSNIMRSTIYGGVPILYKMKQKEFHAFVEEEIHSLDFDVDDYDYYVMTKTNLMFGAFPDMRPEFLWIFPNEFIQKMV